MATADYTKGTANGYEEMLKIILGWLTSTDNASGKWTIIQDYVDTGQANNDGERNVILRSEIAGELPIYIGLRTARGYLGKQQQCIQLNAYTNYDANLAWDCQAGSIALPENYVADSHFYEGCPSILIGDEVVCYWLANDDKHVRCIIRTPTVPMESLDTKIRKSVVYEAFYLGWLRRLVSKEGYPYPMSVEGTTFTLGNEDDGYVQRNFAYNNVLGSIRHIPPFHHDYMMYEAISPRVLFARPAPPFEAAPACDLTGGAPCPENKKTLPLYNTNYAYKWPVANKTCAAQTGGTVSYCAVHPDPIPGVSDTATLCGPELTTIPTCMDCKPESLTSGTDLTFRTRNNNLIDLTVNQYDTVNLSNRVLYFDGTWGWSVKYPVRNAWVKSLCWCLIRIKQCGSHNTFENDPGMAPPLSAYAGGITKDQIPAHLGWIPDKIVESLSGHRLLVPCYVACVGSLAEMQSHMREQFGKPDYDAEQQRIHIAGLMEGWYYVPGLGLTSQDVLKIPESNQTVQYIVVEDIYRNGPFNYAAMRLGVKEFHETNPDSETPMA
jgi:hypothetical protein